MSDNQQQQPTTITNNQEPTAKHCEQHQTINRPQLPTSQKSCLKKLPEKTTCNNQNQLPQWKANNIQELKKHKIIAQMSNIFLKQIP
ncbi:MAG: hypothetical protein ACK559_26205, partial [bacterium]